MNDTIDFLQSVMNRAVGPGVKNIQRVQLWDLYSTLPFYNDSNLAGTNATLFTFKQNDVVSGPGFTAASPQYKETLADTNVDAPGTIPFDMFIHGLSFDIINRQQIPGVPGTANDEAFYPTMKAAYLSDIALNLNINNLDVDILPALEAPAGAGMWGSFAMGTTAALVAGASISATSNGWPSASNYRDYSSEGPFFTPQNTTIKLGVTFGNSILAANTVYKPANTGSPALFLKAILRGFRIWYAQ